MPGQILVEDSVVMCFHAGMAEAMIPYPRAIIGGAPVICIDSPYVIEGCVMPPPPIGEGPCVMGEWMTGAFRVMGEEGPVLVQLGEAVCEITGMGLLSPFGNPFVIAE